MAEIGIPEAWDAVHDRQAAAMGADAKPLEIRVGVEAAPVWRATFSGFDVKMGDVLEASNRSVYQYGRAGATDPRGLFLHGMAMGLMLAKLRADA